MSARDSLLIFDLEYFTLLMFNDLSSMDTSEDVTFSLCFATSILIENLRSVF